MELPVVYWVPSIAPSGMSFYGSGVFDGWQGNLFVGALAGQHLRRLVVEGREIVHQEVLFEGELGRIRDVREGPDGFLYLLTDARNGALLRLEPVR
jgi:glucose/arabinose dehydrogenase